MRKNLFLSVCCLGLPLLAEGGERPAQLSGPASNPSRWERPSPGHQPAAAEPNFQIASEWWADLPNIWTPVGWKDHLFRFNVLWNGSILAKPNMNRRSQSWAGQGLQLSVTPSQNEGHDDWSSGWLRHDDGMVRQGWDEDDAPVLWSEWSKDGLLLRSGVFAHLAGGGDVQTGIEPLFLWIRLSVHELAETLPLEEDYGFNLLLQAPHVSTTMSMRDNVRFSPDQARYPRPLRPESNGFDPEKDYLVLEEDSKVRLAVAPGGDCKAVKFSPANKDQSWSKLHVRLPARKGAHVDLLLPMLPGDRQALDAELALGYEGARFETRRYWQKITACATRFEVPEGDINDCIQQSIRFSNLLTEKNPATGKYCKVNGSWTYADLWTTPGSMDLVMLMDTLGHHGMVERYLNIFLEEQGTVKPPGPAYELHPGYFSTPALYKSIDWLSDNGAVLYTLATHALLSGDREFIARSTEGIVRSCEWIAESRRKKNYGGFEGLLPPAVATDNRTEIQAVWSIGWNYKGLCAAVRLLQQIRHPRATEFAREAEVYKETLQKAIRDKCRQLPFWQDDYGQRRQLVPTTLAGGEKSETRHAFYLDTGPLFLVFAGLMEARDPLMQDTCAWFRAGPQRKLYRRDSNCWQVPVLDHEMSSCEHCYSWNMFHSWQLGERERFLEGMYSLFAGSMSRKTRISCETRGGITGNVFSAPLAVYLARLAVIDDQLSPGELHLLRLMPLAWLAPEQPAIFRQMPTEYGPVTVETRLSQDGKTLEVTYQPVFRVLPRKVWLHRPPVQGLKTVKVNGKTLRFGKSMAVALE
ncbi:MAG: hypothetical protein L0Z50_04345 [Verrucomicrobiales bacterium]|nr:hypothetical protein [Verrucomicrobiales bacterium]